MNRSLNILLSGGGTGGHIYPAIAIANALREIQPDCHILFVGANKKMEMEKVPSAGYTIKGIDIKGFQRKWILKNFLLPYYIFKSVWQTQKIIQSFQPHIVIGTGGYVSFPVLITAQFLGIPTYIQEQNAYAGLANKLLSKKCRKIFVAFDNMEKFFPTNKIVFSGNPVRKDLLNTSNKKSEAVKFFAFTHTQPIVLVLGGSIGAKSINTTIANNLSYFIENGIQLIWQTGRNFYTQLSPDLKNTLKHPLIYYKDFIYEMDMAYAAADIIISRAGASTIAELQVVGKPAILIPSPNVTADHQTKNALSLTQKNAAILVKDQNLKIELIQQLDRLLKNKELQQTLSSNIQKLARPFAARHIAETILNDFYHLS